MVLRRMRRLLLPSWLSGSDPRWNARGRVNAGAALAMLLPLAALAQVQTDPRIGEDMSPNLGAFFGSLYNVKGEWCCTVADTRTTEVRIVAGHFEAWIDGRFNEVANGSAKAGWYPIPDAARVPDRENPLGEPIVSFFRGTVRCFLDLVQG